MSPTAPADAPRPAAPKRTAGRFACAPWGVGYNQGMQQATFCALPSGEWGVRLENADPALSRGAEVVVTKRNGDTKTVVLASLVDRVTRRGVMVERWSLQDTRPVYRGPRGRGSFSRSYEQASYASQAAAYDLAEPSPAPAPVVRDVLALAWDEAVAELDAIQNAEPDDPAVVFARLLSQPSRLTPESKLS